MTEWPDELPGYHQMAARWAGKAKPFAKPPDLIVMHSGSVGANVAGYLATVPDGRMVSAHFAWLPGQGCFVQMVPLDRQAWHAGPLYNGRSIGIELSGPWHQRPRARDETDHARRLLRDLMSAVPSLRYWARHSDLSMRKRDPGPGWPDHYCDELGLERLRHG